MCLLFWRYSMSGCFWAKYNFRNKRIFKKKTCPWLHRNISELSPGRETSLVLKFQKFWSLWALYNKKITNKKYLRLYWSFLSRFIGSRYRWIKSTATKFIKLWPWVSFFFNLRANRHKSRILYSVLYFILAQTIATRGARKF